jgi:cutinase
MKFSLSLVALAASAFASPIVLDLSDISQNELEEIHARDIEARQSGTTANEFLNGGCRDVVLIFARGTSQSGNLGEMPGVDLSAALKSALGASRVATQGVGYSASLLGNLQSGGCPPREAADMTALIGQVASQCPSAKIVVSGYSQGAAMVHRSIEGASAAVKARIVAAVTFGDTQNAQDGGRIPGFDTTKTRIFCNNGDRVCDGTLIITGAHSDYRSSINPAVTFIRGRV